MRDAFKTIVEGRSVNSTSVGNFPRGLEILLKKASIDESFAHVLLESPDEAAKLISLDLGDSEKSILASTPKNTLKAMISNTKVKRHQLSAFKTMSASLMLAAIVVISSTAFECSDGDTTVTRGIAPHDTTTDAEGIEMCVSKMHILQQALEQYKTDHDGAYITTTDWHSSNNPLKDYRNL